MNFPKLLSVLKSEPLFCDNDYRANLLELLNQHATLSKEEFKAAREGIGECGESIDLPQMTIEGSLAIIPIGGPIGSGLGAREKGMGCVDVQDISDDIDAAEADDAVENIVLNFDSPGGMVTGTPELAAKIRTVEKPIYAYCAGTMCSGAYYLASSCSGIFVSPSSRSGNIGVYTTFMDLSRMADMEGIAVKVFSSGPYKGAGVPGTSLSPEQEIDMKKNVMAAAKAFYAHVQSTRPQVSADDMQGQWYWGAEAVAKGLADDIMPTLADLKTFLS